MTTDIVTTEWFDHQKESRRLRFIQHEGTTYVPILDLASATGMRKRSLLKVVSKNPIAFEKHTKSLHLETVSGLQETSCLDRDGAMLLMFKISTNSIRNPETKARLGEFQKWQIKKMGQPLALPAPQPEIPKGPDYPGIIQKLKFIRSVHEETGWNLLELQKEVLREAGMISLTYHIEPAEKKIPYPPVALPAPPKPKDYLTATDIGNHPSVQKSAHEVNMMLYQRKPPLLIKDRKGEWRLTEHGHEYGSESIRELDYGAFVWRIKWKRDVLRLFNIYDHEEMG
jgi:hypothetical protein